MLVPAMEEYIPIKKFAVIAGLSVDTVYRRLRDGKLKAMKIGAKTVIPRAEADRFFAACSAWAPTVNSAAADNVATPELKPRRRRKD